MGWSPRAALRTAWHKLSFEQRQRVMQSRFARVLYRNVWAPPGHFYSPYAHAHDLRAIPEPGRSQGALPGIDLREDAQRKLLAELGLLWSPLGVPEFPAAGWRYHLSNAPFAYADGAILAAMLLHLRPRRYIEVGSGWSTCLALDVRDRCPGVIDSITVIDPHPDPRVRVGSCVLIEQRLQDLPASAFDELTSGDLLFIDSTHVAKAGSDVNRLIFEVLPRLNPGVFVHVHDVHWPFEYPRDWLLGGRAWQESYVLRAFLEFNDSYEISLWGSFMFFNDREYLGEHLPVALVSQGGGSIWLRRRDHGEPERAGI